MWITAITVLAAVLRFATLTSQSFWFDEAQAVHEMQVSLQSMWHLWSSAEPNPPLYFLIAWPWARLFGTGEAGLRSLSALLGTVTVPLVYLSARELISRRAGTVAAALTAINPFLIWYSQETREYMLLTALSAASLLCFARMWKRPGPHRRDLIGWAVFSGLALLTQYFAGFLVGAEALALLYRHRTRATAAALGALVIVEAITIPHLTGHVSHPAGWIDQFPLATRIQQVPVAFALNTLYRGADVSYGLLGAAVVAAALIVTLLIGATGPQLRGAGLAAALAAAVVVVPLLLALVGSDYYEARALIAGWIPLIIVVGAACGAPRARAAGAILALVLGALFLYGQAEVQYGSAFYRRPDWRGAARALGPARGTRAVVAFDGQFAAPSLALYLPGVRWTGSGQIPQTGQAPVTVSELDIVGDSGQRVASPLPAAVRLISLHPVGGYLAVRFALTHPTAMTPSALGTLAAGLLGPQASPGSVLIQQPMGLTSAR